jgi:hypothetical protein
MGAANRLVTCPEAAVNVDEGQFDISVHRLFDDDPNVPRSLLQGLNLSRFSEFDTARRGRDGPFSGIAAEKLNSCEAFFRDALRAIREKALIIPDPCGDGEVASTDVLVSPSDPWRSVPVFAFRFSHVETFYFVKRGHTWCTDIGLFFPTRRLLVSFQRDAKRIKQDLADLRQVFRFIGAHRDESSFKVVPGDPLAPPCVIVNSGHFAHHIWHELSAVEGLIAEGLHNDVLLLVNRRPLADLADLFPEIPKTSIVDMAGSEDEPFLYAMRNSLFVAPVGRRFIPRRVIERILDHGRAQFPDEYARATGFRDRHELVLWVTIRVDARTATNLVSALAASISALLRHYPGMGVVFDGFTRPSNGTFDISESLTDREERAVVEILSLVARPFDHVALSRKSTIQAFLWAEIADFYVCPYGTAQHKIAWINPVPGIVHAGENKRPVAAVDGAYHALQRGHLPAFFFGTVSRNDSVATDPRSDLLSYDLDVEAFAAFVEAAVRVREQSPSASSQPGFSGDAIG